MVNTAANMASPPAKEAYGVRAKLIKLELAQTSTLPFPTGSTVWYKVNGQMASGIVKSIFIDITHKHRGLRYEIESPFNGGNSVTEIVSDDDMICLGAGCPICVKMKTTSTSDFRELDGQILHGNVNGTVKTYTVMLFLGRQFMIEESVAQERIEYRQITAASEVDNCDHVKQLNGTRQSCTKSTIPASNGACAKSPDEILSSGNPLVLSSYKSIKPSSYSFHEELNSSPSSTKKSLRSLPKDDRKRSRPMLKDVSNQGNRRQVDVDVADSTNARKCLKAKPKCDQTEKKEKSWFRIDIPSRLVENRESQMKLFSKFNISPL